jgi:PHB de-polymerase C-terminus
MLDYAALVFGTAFERSLVDFGLPGLGRHLQEGWAECSRECENGAGVVDIFVDQLVVHAYAMALARPLRHQRNFGEGVVDVIKDQRGFCDWLTVMDQCRDNAVRIEFQIGSLELVPAQRQAAPSPLSVLADASAPAAFHEVVRLGDGLVPGRKILKLWGPASAKSEDIRRLLQSEESPGSPVMARLEALFRDWYAWTVDLPGTFFLEVVEQLYQRNAIASGTFRALGATIDLASVCAPMFLLAGRDDEVVAPPQLFAVERLVGTPSRDIRKVTVGCPHLGLFLGKRVLRDVWPDIAQWLTTPSSLVTKRQKAVDLRSAA